MRASAPAAWARAVLKLARSCCHGGGARCRMLLCWWCKLRVVPAPCRLAIRHNNSGPPDAVLYDQPLGWWDPDWPGCFKSRDPINSTHWYSVTQRFMGMHTRCVSAWGGELPVRCLADTQRCSCPLHSCQRCTAISPGTRPLISSCTHSPVALEHPDSGRASGASLSVTA